jgi:predicted metal-dependent phosphoesterase TrpH
VNEALTAADEVGLRLVPGVEISAFGPRSTDLHVLGYLIDVDRASLSELLESSRTARFRRADAMADALRELGFALDSGPLEMRRAEGKPIGRPHLAQAVVSHPRNRERLEREGLAAPSSFLEAYLVPGRPGFQPRALPSVATAVAAIHQAGGVAVWAHPFWDRPPARVVLETIDRFKAVGMDGVECFYPVHTVEQTNLLANRCEALGLLSTGSSDFHGPGHGEFSSFRSFRTYGHSPNLGPIAR